MGFGRDVTLKIKVDDSDVPKAEASLKRLNAAANGSGSGSSNGALTQQEKLARFMGSDMPQAAGKAEQAISAVESATAGAGEAATGAASGFGAFGIAIGVVAAAAVAAVVAVGLLAKAAFDLAKAFADHAIEAGNLAEQQGLQVQTSIALRAELDAQGRSYLNIEGALDNFKKTIGEAAGGSEKARASLKLLGIDGTKAIFDIDGAFKTAAQAIANAPGQFEAVRLAIAAFGDDGAKLLPFFNDFKGNVDALIKKAEELGITMSGENVRAAREFNRAYSEVQNQIQAVKLEFGKEFLPLVRDGLRSLSEWFKENKDDVKSWAGGAVTFLEGVKAAVVFLVHSLEGYYLAAKKIKDLYDTINHPSAAYGPTTFTPEPTPAPQPEQQPTTPTGQPDAAAVAAMIAQQEAQRKEALDRSRTDIAAQIQLLNEGRRAAENAFEQTFKTLEADFEKNGNGQQFLDRLETAISLYRGVLISIRGEIVKVQAVQDKLAEKPLTPAERSLRDFKGAQDDSDGIQKGIDARVKAEEKVAAATAAAAKKALQEALRFSEEDLATRRVTSDRTIALAQKTAQGQIEAAQFAVEEGKKTQREYLDYVKQVSLDALAVQKAQLNKQLGDIEAVIKMHPELSDKLGRQKADVEGKIAIVEEQTTRTTSINQLTAEETLRREINKLKSDDIKIIRERQSLAQTDEEANLVREIKALQDALARNGVNDGLEIEAAHLRDILDLRHREVDAVIAINRAQLEISHQLDISNNQIRAGVYEHIAQQKTMSQAIADGINKTYDSLTALVNGPLDKLDQKTKGLLSFIIEPLKAFSNIQTGKIFTGLVDAIFPGMGSQIEKAKNPVLGELKDQTKILEQIRDAVGGGSGIPGIGGGGGGGFGGIFSRIFGGGAGGGGNGPGGTPNFNPAAGNGPGGILPSGSLDADGNVVVNGNQRGGGIFSNLKNLFSTKEGGIFAPRHNLLTGNDSKWGGILGGAGGLVGLLGGIIGGRTGSVLSSIGTFTQIGSLFGPIGAGIGAVVGAIAGFVGINKQRRKDETSRAQTLKATEDAINKEFEDMMTQLRFGSIDPASAIVQATNDAASIKQQYIDAVSQLKDGKTRRIALAEIPQRIDPLIARKTAELKGLADIAAASADRSQRILPEFAGGVFISSAFRDFQRVNGMLSGSWTGNDYRAALLADAEMVLNPMQQSRIRSAAGFDVFAGAGIPNYPGTVPAGSMASGGIVGGSGSAVAMQPVIQNNFTLFIEGATFDENTKAWAESDAGERVLVNIIKKKKKSGDIS